MDKIRFSVIGAGHIGQRHAEMVMRHSSAQLVAICDVNAEVECAIKDEIPFFSSAEEMLMTGPACDVVCICSPNGLHFEHAMLALRSNKHVVIEKPMALTKTDCENIIMQAKNVQREIFCVMQNRYSPPSIWIKGLLDQKTLGDIFMVNINCFWNRDERYYQKSKWKGSLSMDGGTLFTQFSHFIDMMYWLFGDIKNIQAQFRDFNHASTTEFEDSGIVTFEFENGGIGSINFSTSIQHVNFESSLTIVAQNGTVKLGGQYMNEIQYCDIQNYTLPELPPSNPANDYGHYKGSAANHGYVISNVIDTLLGKTSATTNAMEGLKVVDIIERIYKSSSRPMAKIQKSESF